MSEDRSKRNSERQEFMKNLLMQIRDVEEESHQRLSIQTPLISAIAYCLAAEDGVDIKQSSKTEAYKLLTEVLEPRIKEFAKTPEEYNFILSEILTHEAGAVARRFLAKIHAEELDEPDEIFEPLQPMNKVTDSLTFWLEK